MEKQRLKLQNSVPVEKRERNRNYRRVEKEYMKRKYSTRVFIRLMFQTIDVEVFYCGLSFAEPRSSNW